MTTDPDNQDRVSRLLPSLEMEPKGFPKDGLRHKLWRLGWRLLSPAVFLVCFLTSASLHLRSHAVQLLLVDYISEKFSAQLQGSITAKDVDLSTLPLIKIGEFQVFDPTGQRVLDVKNLKIRLWLRETIKALLNRNDTIVIQVKDVEADYVNVSLVEQDGGGLTLSQAFLPNIPSEDIASAPTPLLLQFPSIRIQNIESKVALKDVIPFSVKLARLHGGMDWSPTSMRITLDDLGLNLRSDSDELNLKGKLSAQATIPGNASANFDGSVLGFPTAANFSITEGKSVQARLKITEAKPESIRHWVPNLVLQSPANLNIEANGELPNLNVYIDASLRESTLISEASVKLSSPLSVKLKSFFSRIDAADFDLTALGIDLKSLRGEDENNNSISINIEADGEATFDKEKPSSILNAEIHPKLPKFDLPPIRLEYRQDAKQMHLGAFAQENGAKLNLGITLPTETLQAKPQDAVQSIEAELSAELDFDRFKRAPPELKGKSSVVGSFNLGKDGQGSGHLNFESKQLSFADVSAQKLKGRVRIHGEPQNWQKLAFDSSINIEELNISGTAISQTEFIAKGNVQQSLLTLKTKIGSKTEISVSAPSVNLLNLSTPSLEVKGTHDNFSLSGKLRDLDIKQQKATLDSLQLGGKRGQLSGNANIRGSHWQAKIKAKSLSIAELAKDLGVTMPLREGMLDFDLDYSNQPSHQGTLLFRLEKAQLQDTSKLSVTGQIKIEPETNANAVSSEELYLVRSAIEWEESRTGQGRLSSMTHLSGDPLKTSTWFKGLGSAKISLPDIPITPYLALLPKFADHHIEGGKLSAEFDWKRDGTNPPNAQLQLNLKSLKLVKEDSSSIPLDFDWLTQYHGKVETLESRLAVSLSASPLIETRASIPIEYQTVISGEINPSELNLESSLILSRHRLANLPIIQDYLRNLDGFIDASLYLNGPLDELRAGLKLQLSDLQTEYLHSATPLSVNLIGDYAIADKSAILSLALKEGSQEIAQAQGTIDLENKYRDIPHWSFNLKTHQLPAERIPTLLRSSFTGKIDGDLKSTLDDNGLSAEINLSTEDLNYSNKPAGDFAISAQINQGGISGYLNWLTNNDSLRLDFLAASDASETQTTSSSSSTKKDKAEIEVENQRSIVDKLLPRVSVVESNLKAEHFPIAHFEPLIKPSLSRLSGELDGQLRIYAATELQDFSKLMASVKWNGNFALADASFFVSSLGMEFKRVNTNLLFSTESDSNHLVIQDLQASARSDAHNIKAVGTAEFQGLILETARLRANLKKVPLMLSGVSQGDATGKLIASIDPLRPGYRADIRFEGMKIELPKVTHSGVINEEANPDYQIVQERQAKEDEEEQVTQNITPWIYAIDLSDGIALERPGIQLTLRGKPWFDKTDKLSGHGIIHLDSGSRVDVINQPFIIEQGTVALNPEDVSNPDLNITAVWRAADGTRVYATLSGNLKRGKLRLHSDPAKSETEIFALLLGAKSSEGMGAAAGAAALNQLLGTTGGPVNFRAGSTAENSATYTAAVQVADDLWFEGNYTHLNKTSSPNQPNNVFSGTVDYRMTQDWSFRTEAGSSGGSLELLWQYRY